MQSLNDPPPPLHLAAALPETVGYRLKRRLLGPPLITRQLSEERLSNPLALGVLSSDCISSSAYGSEEMLLVLLPAFGVAAFTLLLPLTGVRTAAGRARGPLTGSLWTAEFIERRLSLCQRMRRFGRSGCGWCVGAGSSSRAWIPSCRPVRS